MIPAILRCTFSRYTKRLCIFERVMRVRPFIRYLRAFAVGVALLPLCCMQAQEGKSSFDVLNLPVSSHINALGGNNISIVEEDITVMYHNPALMGQEMSMQMAANYMRYVAGINLGGVSYAQAARKHGTWALGLQFAGYGTMKQTDATGVITGSFSPKDILLSGLYAHDITSFLRGGIQAKLLYSSYESYTALAMFFDLGINYYHVEKELSLSLVVKNLGGQLKKYDTENIAMPWDIQLGFSKTLHNVPFRFSITAQHLTRWHLPFEKVNDAGELEVKDNFASNLFRHLVFGVDYIPSRNFYLAIGYDYKRKSDMTTAGRRILSGFTAGAGVRVKMFGIGVSMAQHHANGFTFMTNITADISQFLR